MTIWSIRSAARRAHLLGALALIAACGTSPASDEVNRAILGQRPSYGPGSISAVPNLAAIDRLIWMPGLDAGWDPQGLTFAEGSLLISGYRSNGMWANRGPCRVFRVDPVTGSTTGHFDVPSPCGHAGGLAYAGGGKLFIADTHTLFEVDLDCAFTEPIPRFRIFPLDREVTGAFAVSGHGEIWIGNYEEARPAKAFKYDVGILESLHDGEVLRAESASAIVAIPSYGQGGAGKAPEKLWISRSDLGWGFLDRLDAVTGQLEKRYAVAAGIEGIAFDATGHLWGVSEAGARHLPLRHPFFPLIFRLNPTRLHGAE